MRRLRLAVDKVKGDSGWLRLHRSRNLRFAIARPGEKQLPVHGTHHYRPRKEEMNDRRLYRCRLIGKCPFNKYKQGGAHRPFKADMSILTDGRLPEIPTGKTAGATDIGATALALYLYDVGPGKCV